MSVHPHRRIPEPPPAPLGTAATDPSAAFPEMPPPGVVQVPPGTPSTEPARTGVRSTTARDRGEGFTGSAAPIDRTGIRLPVMSLDPDHPFPCTALMTALARRGWSAGVVPPALGSRGSSGAESVSPPPAALVESMREPTGALWLVPVHVDQVGVATAERHLLLAVPTSAWGVRDAYRQLKSLAADGYAGHLGVVMMDAPSPEAAAAHFDRLAVAAHRFLALPVASFGHLPTPPEPHAAIDLLRSDGHLDPSRGCMEGVAALLAREWIPSPSSPVATTAGQH